MTNDGVLGPPLCRRADALCGWVIREMVQQRTKIGVGGQAIDQQLQGSTFSEQTKSPEVIFRLEDRQRTPPPLIFERWLWQRSHQLGDCGPYGSQLQLRSELLRSRRVGHAREGRTPLGHVPAIGSNHSSQQVIRYAGGGRRRFEAMSRKTPRIIEPGSGNCSPGLADGVEQQQRRCGRSHIGGSVHELLGLLQRGHEYRRPLVVVLDASGWPCSKDSDSLPRQHGEDDTPADQEGREDRMQCGARHAQVRRPTEPVSSPRCAGATSLELAARALHVGEPKTDADTARYAAQGV
jgi:hypothetical protein